MVLLGWQEGRFELLASPLMLAELERALAYPKLQAHIPPSEAKTALRLLRDGATVVDDPSTDPPTRSEDPDDDYLIALAAEERAALVSGDRHLLDLRERIPVYAPREFLGLMTE